MSREKELERHIIEIHERANRADAENAKLREALRRCVSSLKWADENWTKAAVDRGAGLPMMRAALAAGRKALEEPA